MTAKVQFIESQTGFPVAEVPGYINFANHGIMKQFDEIRREVGRLPAEVNELKEKQ